MASWSPTRAGAAEREQAHVQENFLLREDIKWLMGSVEGRRIVARLAKRAGVLQGSLANSTATVQSGLVAVHDFVVVNLVNPILEHCPHRFLEMKAEND